MSVINKVKSLGARAVMSAQDVRAHLENDHDRFKDIAGQMCEAHAPSRRRLLLGQLKPILVAHARAEERVVYDALLKARTPQTTHTLAQEGYVEHTIVDELLAKLEASDASTDVWLAHARVLRELLTAHIDEEQSDTFAELGATFSNAELDAMGARFEREKTAVARAAKPRQRSAASRLELERRSGHRPKAAGNKAAKRAGRAAAARPAAKTRASAGRATRRRSSGQRSG